MFTHQIKIARKHYCYLQVENAFWVSCRFSNSVEALDSKYQKKPKKMEWNAKTNETAHNSHFTYFLDGTLNCEVAVGVGTRSFVSFVSVVWLSMKMKNKLLFDRWTNKIERTPYAHNGAHIWVGEMKKSEQSLTAESIHGILPLLDSLVVRSPFLDHRHRICRHDCV